MTEDTQSAGGTSVASDPVEAVAEQLLCLFRRSPDVVQAALLTAAMKSKPFGENVVAAGEHCRDLFANMHQA